MDPISRLQASIDQTRPIVAAVPPDQFSTGTPCEGWDVRALANHLLGALAMFRDVATDGQADVAALERDHIGGNLADAYDAIASATVRAWSEAGKMDGAANMPWGEMPANLAVQMLADDVLVHGWDLATATGQQVSWDQALAAETLEFATMMFASPEIRAGSFAEPVAVAEDADAMTKLVAFLGRQT